MRRQFVWMALTLAGCGPSETGWIHPANALESRLVDAARHQSDSNLEAFGAALRGSEQVFAFVAGPPRDGSATVSIWMPPMGGKHDVAVYTSRQRLDQSPLAGHGAVAWAGFSGRGILQVAAHCGWGVVVNYGLLPQIEISRDEVKMIVQDGGDSAAQGTCGEAPA